MQLASEAKKAQKERDTKLPPRPRGRLRKHPVAEKQKIVEKTTKPQQKALNLQRTVKGRVEKPSAKLRA